MTQRGKEILSQKKQARVRARMRLARKGLKLRVGHEAWQSAGARAVARTKSTRDSLRRHRNNRVVECLDVTTEKVEENHRETEMTLWNGRYYSGPTAGEKFETFDDSGNLCS